MQTHASAQLIGGGGLLSRLGEKARRGGFFQRYHLALVRLGAARQVRLYVNGILDSEQVDMCWLFDLCEKVLHSLREVCEGNFALFSGVSNSFNIVCSQPVSRPRRTFCELG